MSQCSANGQCSLNNEQQGNNKQPLSEQLGKALVKTTAAAINYGRALQLLDDAGNDALQLRSTAAADEEYRMDEARDSILSIVEKIAVEAVNEVTMWDDNWQPEASVVAHRLVYGEENE